MQNEHISSTIKKLCEEKRMPVRALLDECNLSSSFIYDLEKRAASPSCKKLSRIADYFSCSVDYLLGRTDDPVLHKLKEEICTDTVSNKNAKTSSSQPDGEAEAQQLIARQYFDMPASAGAGEWLGDDSSYSIINVPLTDESKRADFIIRVAGDSMEPKFYSGDRLLILKTQALDIGDIGVFVLNGESYVKKLGNSTLVSLNPTYRNIPYGKDDTISVVGKVIGKV